MNDGSFGMMPLKPNPRVPPIPNTPPGPLVAVPDSNFSLCLSNSAVMSSALAMDTEAAAEDASFRVVLADESDVRLLSLEGTEVEEEEGLAVEDADVEDVDGLSDDFVDCCCFFCIWKIRILWHHDQLPNGRCNLNSIKSTNL